MDELGKMVQRLRRAAPVDCVTSLGGVPILLDQWVVDAAY